MTYYDVRTYVLEATVLRPSWDCLWCVPESSNARLPSQKSKIYQLSCAISRRHAPFFSSSLGILRVDESSDDALNKNGCACEEIYFLCICTMLVILTSILSALTHLVTLLLYSGHQFMHCTVLLCMQYNVKLFCLFSGWFAKEANVANNKQRLANFMTQSQRRTGTL